MSKTPNQKKQKKQTKVEYYFDGQTVSDQSSNSHLEQADGLKTSSPPRFMQSEARYNRLLPSDGDEESSKQFKYEAAKSAKSTDRVTEKHNFTTLSRLNNDGRANLDASQLTMSVNASRMVAQNLTKSNAWRLCGVVILVCAIIGGSSIGTIANFVPVQTSFAKNAWRSGIIVTLFIIPTLLEYFYKRREVNYRELLSFKQYGFLLMTLMFQVMWTAGLIYASLNTIQSQAYVFNNVHGLYIVLIGLFLGQLPSNKEWIGVALAIMGCVCIIMDPQAGRMETGEGSSGFEKSFWPAIIDLASAFFGALYFIMSAQNVKNLPVCLLILIMNVHTWMINGLIAQYQNPEIALFSFDTELGCLGFLNLADNPWLPLFCYALFGSFFGSAGYVLCLLFYSPLVTSNAYLLEPFFAQMLGFGLGLDQLPGIMTAIGTLFAVAGIAFIDSGSRERTKTQQEAIAAETKDKSGEELLNLSMLNQSKMSLSGLNISHYSGR